ncbi:hypothetical protein GCM10007872_28470 [Gluconobacter sphaericus NBRC 12467]|uniref:Uncharacterized protein n=1 Tax=Gluconobacter sphaericus NBRC 12467 TaxID=1307951 RepID=A0AA37SHP6_9PROT|nr:hypothetical protein AA12467_0184 [Gluconobacter sphaericus NBRC 12467]GEB43018.1 hypothetical protein GSP01_18000 [Gluconobacter sphaericus NBRC 12467]GLQ85937.1 hypothetical protein GCM10007872_28470 [Gluconobacter sphaericus NBRC 12467]
MQASRLAAMFTDTTLLNHGLDPSIGRPRLPSCPLQDGHTGQEDKRAGHIRDPDTGRSQHFL